VEECAKEEVGWGEAVMEGKGPRKMAFVGGGKRERDYQAPRGFKAEGLGLGWARVFAGDQPRKKG